MEVLNASFFLNPIFKNLVMKSLLGNWCLFFVVISIFACSDDDGDVSGVDYSVPEDACYVLNSGDWKSNNSSLTMFDIKSGVVVQNFFEKQNGRMLGNIANDIIIYGSKMYIAVAGEGTVEVTDLNAKSIKQVVCGAEPRYMVAHEGNVYISYYDGYVARLDTVTLAVDAKVAVGRNPERLDVLDGMLYVANSGGMDYDTDRGYDNTVSLVDLSSFKELRKIEVVINPATVITAEGGVFVVSYGDYVQVPGVLQFIDGNGVVSTVEKCSNMTEVCCKSGVLYGYFSQYDADWNATIAYLSYDIAKDVTDVPWIKEAYLPVPYKVCVAADYICVTSSDYINDGDVYLYDADGMFVAKIPTGLNPVKVVSL